MELIILGLLMLKNCTIYELRKRIETTLSSVSSNSIGSIQAAIKKLLNNGMIYCNEHIENSVNKKVYGLTDEGKALFFDSISKPMLYKEKNMELGKFFFMGFVPTDKRVELIDAYIEELKTEKKKLEQFQKSMPDNKTAIENFIANLEKDKMLEQFGEILASQSITEGLKEIALFQYAFLDLSISKLNFDIVWFEQFKDRID